MIVYEDLTTSFQARHLEVPMSRALLLPTWLSAGDAVQTLRDNKFDQAPVESDGKVVGYALRESLEKIDSQRPVEAAYTALQPGLLVSADTSIADLLSWIVEPRLLFVLSGNEVAGFVTVSGFNEQPARGYLYLLFARFEIALGELLRRRFGLDQESSLCLLPVQQAHAVHKAYHEHGDPDTQGDLVSYFNLRHMLEIVAADPDLARLFERSRPPEWAESIGRLSLLRNAVMHPIREVVGPGRTIEQLRALERQTRALTSDCLAALAAGHPTTGSWDASPDSAPVI